MIGQCKGELINYVTNLKAITNEYDQEVAISCCALMVILGKIFKEEVIHYEVRGLNQKRSGYEITSYGFGGMDGEIFSWIDDKFHHEDLKDNFLCARFDADYRPLHGGDTELHGALVVTIKRSEYEEEELAEMMIAEEKRRRQEEEERARQERKNKIENSLLLKKTNFASTTRSGSRYGVETRRHQRNRTPLPEAMKRHSVDLGISNSHGSILKPSFESHGLGSGRANNFSRHSKRIHKKDKRGFFASVMDMILMVDPENV